MNIKVGEYDIVVREVTCKPTIASITINPRIAHNIKQVINVCVYGSLVLSNKNSEPSEFLNHLQFVVPKNCLDVVTEIINGTYVYAEEIQN